MAAQRLVVFPYKDTERKLQVWATTGEAEVAVQQIYNPIVEEVEEEEVDSFALEQLFEEKEVEAYHTLTLTEDIYVVAKGSYTWRPKRRLLQPLTNQILLEPAHLELIQHGLMGLPAIGRVRKVGLPLINTSDNDIIVPAGTVVAMASNNINRIDTNRQQIKQQALSAEGYIAQSTEANTATDNADVNNHHITDEELLTTLDRFGS
ncbi:hypothetical protein BDF19DRAFT_411434 [Syncephalis fuscata]|nr:hypothetical protein BDF19DRAFT_411434 [Syncephalis fuscata]